jgi:NAD(P)-dependent dehydrogenase (short-subunit alcohol dehydrogenase family)
MPLWMPCAQPGRIARMAEQRVAFVTGGGRGIGAAIGRGVAKAGARVALGARTVAECEQVAREIERGGGRAIAVELDVTDASSVREAVARTEGEFGPIDWLVNNAGIAVSAPFASEGELYQRHLDVNFHGARRMIEAVLPAMKARKHGRIVNVASSAALRGYRYVAAYAASKHALLGYARCAALELEKTGVAIATLCPHYVDSPMTDEAVRRVVAVTKKSESEARAFFAAENPGGRLVTVDEVAAAVVELLERGANGEIRELDGSGK